jgi:hypothetical protein
LGANCQLCRDAPNAARHWCRCHVGALHADHRRVWEMRASSFLPGCAQIAQPRRGTCADRMSGYTPARNTPLRQGNTGDGSTIQRRDIPRCGCCDQGGDACSVVTAASPCCPNMFFARRVGHHEHTLHRQRSPLLHRKRWRPRCLQRKRQRHPLLQMTRQRYRLHQPTQWRSPLHLLQRRRSRLHLLRRRRCPLLPKKNRHHQRDRCSLVWAWWWPWW